MALPEHLIDKRIVRRTLASGKVDAKEYNEMLASLPDLTDQVASGQRDDDDYERADPTEP